VTAISATSNADTGTKALEIQDNLTKARKDQTTKQAAYDKAKKEFDESDKKATTAKAAHTTKAKELETAKGTTVADSDTAGKEAKKARIATLESESGALEATATKARADADEKKPAKEEAKKLLSDQNNTVASLEKRLEAASAVSAGGSSKIEIANCGECKPKSLSDKSVTTIANTVKDIVNQTFELDEVELRCLKFLNSPKEKTLSLESYKSTNTFCVNYLSNKVDRDKNSIEAKQNEIAVDRLKIAKELAEDPKLKPLFDSIEFDDE
jgi:hypothetical protein